MRKTGLVRVRMWLRVEYVQLVFILTIPNDTRKSIFFTREWNDSFLRLWSYQNVAKMHTWCMILVVLTRCVSGRQNFVRIWQLVWFEWAKKCYGILKVKEFCDERFLYRASMHKIINIIEKWGYVLFEMMKVHEKYRYMQIST